MTADSNFVISLIWSVNLKMELFSSLFPSLIDPLSSVLGYHLNQMHVNHCNYYMWTRKSCRKRRWKNVSWASLEKSMGVHLAILDDGVFELVRSPLTEFTNWYFIIKFVLPRSFEVKQLVNHFLGVSCVQGLSGFTSAWNLFFFKV